jgi:hypothetical protein
LTGETTRTWFGKRSKDDAGAAGALLTHGRRLSAQFAEEFLLIHAVLKSFVAVDEDYWDLVGVAAPDFGIGVHVDFTPGEAAPLVELDEALFDDFAEMTSLAGINDDFPRLRHARQCSSFGAGFQHTECQTKTA